MIFLNNSEFYCTECGAKGLPIPRKNQKRRGAGHEKHLWCVHCKKITKHIETVEWTSYSRDDFKRDFEQGKWR